MFIKYIMRKYYQIRIFSIITLLAFIFTQTVFGSESRGVFVSAENSHMRLVEPSQARGVGDDIAAELSIDARAVGDFSVPESIEEMQSILHPSLEMYGFAENAIAVINFLISLTSNDRADSFDNLEDVGKDKQAVAAKVEYLAPGFLSWQDVVMISGYMRDDFLNRYIKTISPGQKPADYFKRYRQFRFGLVFADVWMNSRKPQVINSAQDAANFAAATIVSLVIAPEPIGPANNLGKTQIESLNSIPAEYSNIKESALKAIDMIIQILLKAHNDNDFILSTPRPIMSSHDLAKKMYEPVLPDLESNPPEGMDKKQVRAIQVKARKMAEWIKLFRDLMDQENPAPQCIKLDEGEIFITAKILNVGIDSLDFIDIHGGHTGIGWHSVVDVVDFQSLPLDVQNKLLKEAESLKDLLLRVKELVEGPDAGTFIKLKEELTRFEKSNELVDVYLKDGKVFQDVHVEVEGVLGDAVLLKIVSSGRTTYIAKVSFSFIEKVIPKDNYGGENGPAAAMVNATGSIANASAAGEESVAKGMGDNIPGYALPQSVNSVSRNFDDLKQLYPSLEQSLAGLKPNAKILFIGPGRGYEILGIKENYPHLNLDIHSIGAENLFSDPALTESFGFHQGDINKEGLSFYPSGDFDMIIVGVAVTMYIRDKVGMVEEIYQKLKTGGVAFVDLDGTSIVKTEDDPDFTDRTHEQQSVVNFLSRPGINPYGEINIESGTVDIGDDLFMQMVSLKIDKKQDLQKLELPLQMIRHHKINNEFHVVYQISVVGREGVISAAAIGVEANAGGGKSLSPEDIAEIRGLVDQLVALRNWAQPLLELHNANSYNAPAELIEAGFREEAIILQILMKIGAMKGRMLIPCIGSDVLPAMHVPVLGIHKSNWSVQTADGWIKFRMGKLGLLDEDILNNRRRYQEAVEDLDKPENIDYLIRELTRRGNIHSVLLKGVTEFLGREGGGYIQKENVQRLLRQLSAKCLKDNDTIILFDREMEHISFLESLGFEKMELPEDIQDGIRNSDSMLRSYVQTSGSSDNDIDEDVLFYFVHDFAVMKKVRKTEKILSDSRLAGKKVLIVDKDEVSARSSRNDLIKRGVSSKDILPFVILSEDVIAGVEVGAITAIYEIRMQISAATFGEEVSLVVNNVTNNQSAIFNLKNIFYYEVITTTGSDIQDQNKWQAIYQSL